MYRPHHPGGRLLLIRVQLLLQLNRRAKRLVQLILYAATILLQQARNHGRVKYSRRQRVTVRPQEIPQPGIVRTPRLYSYRPATA